MAKLPKHKDNDTFEPRPDGWERFRSAVHAAAKSGPKHRKAEGKPKPETKSAKVPR